MEENVFVKVVYFYTKLHREEVFFSKLDKTIVAENKTCPMSKILKKIFVLRKHLNTSCSGMQEH